MWKILQIFLLLCIASMASAAFDVADKPVRPGCVAIFNFGIRTTPFVTALDLSECQKSIVTNKTMHHNQKSGFYFYLNNKNSDDGAYGYQVIGKTASGIYVIHTIEYGSDSKALDMLLFVELSQRKVPLFARGKQKLANPAVIATLRGYVAGGDRCSGGIRQVSVDGDHVMIQQYAYMNSPEQCQGAKRYTINVRTWQKSSETSLEK